MVKGNLFRYLSIFLALNTCLYLFIFFFNGKVAFNKFDYSAAYHFFPDPRFAGGKFDFLKSLAVFDSQWYLKIADTGYPKVNGSLPLAKMTPEKEPSYAFFPLYPLTINLLNRFIKNTLLTSFIFNNFLLLVNFVLFFNLVKDISNKKLALKTVFLYFLFPLTIFYRSFYTEGMILFLLLLFTTFMVKKKFIFSAFVLGFLMVVKGISLPLLPLLMVFYFKNGRGKKIPEKIVNVIKIVFVSVVPLAFWIYFCYHFTGDPFFFVKVRYFWVHNNIPFISSTSPLVFFLNNLYNIVELPFLSFHLFYSSKVDVIVTFVVLFLLLKSWKKIPVELWWISCLIWIFPLVSTSYIGYSRYQVISFPLFYYLAKYLPGKFFYFFLVIFAVGLFWLSLYFVNWYWVG
ncbi:hypothetical protein M1328_03010 [Patescibacteria group bacterium]|nr:hypothetical protein [Patescibacteria group bacterium]